MADLEHLWPPFRQKVKALLADPEAQQLRVYVVSGFRSIQLQAVLYADALKRYGSPQAAGRWVAPPGRSNHGPKIDDHGHEPGSWGRAVDLGVVGTLAVEGRWPASIKRKMVALADRYEMFAPMQWEDWHHEPKASMYTRPHPPIVATTPLEDDDMAMIVIDPKSPADSAGRLPNWEADQDGNLYNWNGARFLKPLSAFVKAHPPIVGIALEPEADGVVLFGNDTHQEPDGRWVRSTYKITVGL